MLLVNQIKHQSIKQKVKSWSLFPRPQQKPWIRGLTAGRVSPLQFFWRGALTLLRLPEDCEPPIPPPPPHVVGTAPVAQSRGTVPDCSVMLQSCVSQDGPKTSGQTSSTPGALPPKRFQTTSVTSAPVMDESTSESSAPLHPYSFSFNSPLMYLSYIQACYLFYTLLPTVLSIIYIYLFICFHLLCNQSNKSDDALLAWLFLTACFSSFPDLCGWSPVLCQCIQASFLPYIITHWTSPVQSDHLIGLLYEANKIRGVKWKDSKWRLNGRARLFRCILLISTFVCTQQATVTCLVFFCKDKCFPLYALCIASL